MLKKAPGSNLRGGKRSMAREGERDEKGLVVICDSSRNHILRALFVEGHAWRPR